MGIAMVLLGALLTQVGIGAGQSYRSAQSESSTAKGTAQVTFEVGDRSGAGIPNAAIRYQRTSEMLAHKVHTDNKGRAVLELDPGSYDVAVTSPGFRASHRRLEVQGSTSQSVNIVLDVGGCPPGPCLTVGAPLPAAVGAEAAFSIAISTPRSVVEIGDEIRIKIVSRILRTTSFTASRGHGAELVYVLDVRDSDGDEPPESKYLRASKGIDTCTQTGISGFDWRTFSSAALGKPGDAFTDDIDLGGLYDLRLPGKYTVQVSRLQENQALIRSNTLSFTMVPPRTARPSLSTAYKRTARPPFSLTVWLRPPRADHPFDLYVITKNTSDHSITLRAPVGGKPLPAAIYKVDLRYGQGARVPETRLGQLMGDREQVPTESAPALPAPISISLEPGEESCDSVAVDELYFFERFGEYTVQVSRWDDETKAWVKSNAIMDTVTSEQDQFGEFRALLRHGYELSAQHLYAEAAAKFEEAAPLAKGRDLVTVEGRVAESYVNAHQYDKAEEAFQKAIALDPSNAALHNSLASVYLQTNKTPEAQAQLKLYAELDPTSAARDYFNRGVVLYNGLKHDEAAEAFKKAIEINPKFADAYALLGLALMGKSAMVDGKVVAPSGTMEALETYLKLDPNGQFAKAVQAELQMLKQAPVTTYHQ